MQNTRPLHGFLLLLAAIVSTASPNRAAEHPPGPPGLLEVSESSPGYFRDAATDAPVFLRGYDHFRGLQEYDNNGVAPLDFDAFVAKLREYDLNFLRLWTWENFRRTSHGSKGRERGEASVVLPPHVYRRTGPGLAVDGNPAFDLNALDPAYFDRLRRRVVLAGEYGIRVSVMLFQGWSIYGSGPEADSVWEGHPFNRQNNVNGIDGDVDGDGHGWEVHTRVNPRINELHDAYVKAVIDTLGDLGNVLYEVSNESVASADPAKLYSVEEVSRWMNHVVDLVHAYEREKGYGPHPVGVSCLRPLPGFPKSADWNGYLFNSSAEYVSPNGSQWTGDVRWKSDPPPAPVGKVIIADTDHIHPAMHGGPGVRSWQWRSFTRGHSLNAVDGDPEQGEDWVTAEDAKSMQAIARYAGRLDLGRTRPRGDLSTTAYCLADPGRAYIVYQPRGKPAGDAVGAPFSLKVEPGAYHYEWFDPDRMKVVREGTMELRQDTEEFVPPFPGHAVLFLRNALSGSTP